MALEQSFGLVSELNFLEDSLRRKLEKQYGFTRFCFYRNVQAGKFVYDFGAMKEICGKEITLEGYLLKEPGLKKVLFMAEKFDRHFKMLEKQRKQG